MLVQRARADRHLAGVDGGGADLDEHLAGPGVGDLDIGDVEDVAIAIVVKADCAGRGS